MIPEAVPTDHLGVRNFALMDADGTFETTLPTGNGNTPPVLLDSMFTVEDTGGCS